LVAALQAAGVRFGDEVIVWRWLMRTMSKAAGRAKHFFRLF
jgi:hypothetical protein